MATLAQATNQAADQIASLQGIAQANNAASAEQAAIQRTWQEAQNAKAMQFNKVEAAKNRDWQEYMSNTAHQREVRDLLAAGLNPVLSAMNGNGASVTSGATASGVSSAGAKGEIDTATSGAVVNLLGSILQAQTQLESAALTARSQEAIAKTYTEMNEIVANISASASRDVAITQADASKYASDTNWKIKNDFGSGQITSAAGMLLQRLPELKGLASTWPEKINDVLAKFKKTSSADQRFSSANGKSTLDKISGLKR